VSGRCDLSLIKSDNITNRTISDDGSHLIIGQLLTLPSIALKIDAHKIKRIKNGSGCVMLV
jgi:hypothetical protein